MTAVATQPRPEVEPEAEQPAATAPLMDHRQIMLVIYGLMAAMFLSSMAQTVFGTAIRTIGDDLHGLDQQAWVTTAFLITSTVATPLYGKLSDIFGRRPLIILSITIFIVGSVLSSFSTSMLMLAGFRALQGIGAGGLMSLPLAIMGDILAPRERAKYQGFFLAIFGVASVIGPLVGGIFAGAETILGLDGWRWVFLINIPIGLIALAAVVLFLHVPHFSHGRARIDWWGATLVTTTLVPLLLVAQQGRDWGWTSPLSITMYAVGAASLAAFVLVERKMGADAILPLRLFNQKFSLAMILSVLVGFGMFGAMMTIPLYLQIVLGFNPTQSGFGTLPMMLGVMLASIVTGQVVARTGKYGIFPITGSATTAAGFGILTAMTPARGYAFLAVAMAVIGLGLGQLMQTLTLAAQAAAPARDMGVASSSATFFRQIGGTLGTAIMLSMLFGMLPTNITSAMSEKDTVAAALDAALDPAVADAPRNKGIMDAMWHPITDKITAEIDSKMADATQQVKDQVDAKVRDEVSKAAHDKAAEGAGALADGAGQLSSGLGQLSTGTGAFVDGVGKIGDGAEGLAAGASKLSTGSGALADGAGQLSTGLKKISSATQTAAGSAKDATAEFGTLQAAMAALASDQKACTAGQADAVASAGAGEAQAAASASTPAACAKLAADQGKVTDAMKALGTSVYTTSGYLNGQGSTPGIASGISQLSGGADKLAQGSTQLGSGVGQLADGAHKLATGAMTAADKGSALTDGAKGAATGSQKLGQGAEQLSHVEQTINDKVAELAPDAEQKALETVAQEKHLTLSGGRLSVDYADPVQRKAIVDELVPTLVDQVKNGGGSDDTQPHVSTSDTSFLNGADPRLTAPFMTGFNSSVVTIYWLGFGVMVLAFAITCFYRVPPLRTRSALEEKNELAQAAQEGAVA